MADVTGVATPRSGTDTGDPVVEDTGRDLGYQPALDGLRGLAVLGIIVFHAQIRGTGGAFLGVSTFFTLSGFLITTITLADHRRTGRVDATRFYARRARRLLPAAVLAILATAVVTLLLGSDAQVSHLRGDALSSEFYVANWHLIRTGASYAAIFESPSMYTHFWSLAIEEQFYLVFPLALAFALWAGRGSRRVLAGGIAAVTVASVAWSAHVLATSGQDRAYFGTDTRIAELAIGCLLALWWGRRRARADAGAPASGRGRWWGLAAQAAGAAALVAVVAAWHLVERGDQFLYRGGFAVYACLNALVILAALQPGGPVRRLLGLRPIVALGVISYGAYLVHWPIMVVLQHRTALPGEGRLAVGLALTVVIAAASYRFIEQPVRSRRWPPARVAPRVAVAAVAAVAVAIMAVSGLRSVTPPNDYAAASAVVEGTDEMADLMANPEKMTAEQRRNFDDLIAKQRRIDASNAPRIAFVGDSTALMTGLGVLDWAVDNLDRLAPAHGVIEIGCGLVETGQRYLHQRAEKIPARCDGWLDRVGPQLRDDRTQVAIVQFGPWEVRDQRFGSSGPYLALGRDPELDAVVKANLDRLVTSLLAHVPVVELVSPPDIVVFREDGVDPPRDDPASDPARMGRYRELIAEVAAAHDRVGVIDLASYIADRSDEHELRPDGVHFTRETADTVAEWLGPEIERVMLQFGPPPPPYTAPG
jgi:peptidoglycan/LPS O-acetylase OafA/YrhL/lysophospholipase L1-like esterase